MFTRAENSLAAMGYSSSVGTIAVAFKNGNGLHSRQPLLPHTRIEEEVFCIDGRHRKAAMAELVAEEGSEAGKFADMARGLCVSLWYSNQKNVLKNSEILGLSQYLNFSSGCNLRVSFKDRIHASLAQIKTLSVEQDVAIDKMAIGKVANVFQNAIGPIRTPQLKRYAQIGLTLASETDLFSRFLVKLEAEPRLSVAHVCSNRLLRMKGDAILFCLDAVIERIRQKTKGEFKKVRDAFYEYAGVFYKMVRKAGERNNMSAKDVLCMAVPVTKVADIPLRLALCRNISRLIPVENMRKSMLLKSRAAAKKIASLFSEDEANRIGLAPTSYARASASLASREVHTAQSAEHIDVHAAGQIDVTTNDQTTTNVTTDVQAYVPPDVQIDAPATTAGA